MKTVLFIVLTASAAVGWGLIAPGSLAALVGGFIIGVGAVGIYFAISE